MSWLYRYEAKSIQSWILATDRMLELQGGSTLVEQLERHAREAVGRIGGGKFLYAAAGAGTVAFEDRDSLERFARWWPMFVSRHAPGLELVQAWSSDGLGPLRERLGTERNRLAPDLPEAGPWVARAGRSGLSAVDRDEDGGMLDRGTRARARAGEGRDLLGESMTTELSEWLPDPPAKGVRFRRDIARYPRDEGVAVIHADGNQLGKKIHGMSIEQLTRFSQGLTLASRAAGRRAAAGLIGFERSQEQPLLDKNGALLLNGRPIVAGGDDFTFLVRARAGLALAEAWLRAFEEETARAGIGRLTACAGVVFVRRGFPFHRAHEIAERLCKLAKLQYRSHEDQGSRLCFDRVTTSQHDTDEESVRSYSVEETRSLAALVEAADRIEARGKLRQWMAEPDGARAAEQWGRLREVADPDAWRRFEEALAPFPNTEHRTVLRAVLQWGRIHPGRGQRRLWRET